MQKLKDIFGSYMVGAAPAFAAMTILGGVFGFFHAVAGAIGLTGGAAVVGAGIGTIFIGGGITAVSTILMGAAVTGAAALVMDKFGAKKISGLGLVAGIGTGLYASISMLSSFYGSDDPNQQVSQLNDAPVAIESPAHETVSLTSVDTANVHNGALGPVFLDAGYGVVKADFAVPAQVAQNLPKLAA